MNYPLEKYRYYQNGNKIIAVSTYAGKTVRGVSVCHGNDSFNLDTGKKLAALRCNEKIAAKRMKRAADKFAAAEQAVIKAKRQCELMRHYYTDAVNNYNAASLETEDMINSLR
jgi:uncharacterized protein YdaU (DUF1376 family)